MLSRFAAFDPEAALHSGDVRAGITLLLIAGIILLVSSLSAQPVFAEGSSAGSIPFTAARENYRWTFPLDHGSHRDYQTEWWYFTGHLYGGTKQPFRDDGDYGFQLTFFRRALFESTPMHNWEEGYLAHAALSFFSPPLFSFETRRTRSGLGTAGAWNRTLKVWNRDWEAEAIGGRFVLRSEVGAHELRLIATPESGFMLQGREGFSRKGACPSCASQYYSMPRLRLSGEIRTSEAVRPVSGLGWMDHEFMTNALQPDQTGWDWFSVMLVDGRNLMLFRLRSKDRRSDFLAGCPPPCASRRPRGPTQQAPDRF